MNSTYRRWSRISGLDRPGASGHGGLGQVDCNAWSNFFNSECWNWNPFSTAPGSVTGTMLNAPAIAEVTTTAAALPPSDEAIMLLGGDPYLTNNKTPPPDWWMPSDALNAATDAIRSVVPTVPNLNQYIVPTLIVLGTLLTFSLLGSSRSRSRR